MQVDLKNVKVTYTVKEIIALAMLIASIVGSYVRTEIANANCQEQIKIVQQELDKCKGTRAANDGQHYNH